MSVRYGYQMIMKEIEIKLKTDSFDDIRERLAEAGFSMQSKDTETASFFDDDDDGFSARNITVRIKKGEGWASFAVKTKKKDDNYKIADEHESDISDAEAMTGALSVLGLGKRFEYSKEREHWVNGGSAVELDRVSEIDAYFIEVEAGSGEVVEEIIRSLGLQDLKRERRSYPDIVKEIRK